MTNEAPRENEPVITDEQWSTFLEVLEMVHASAEDVAGFSGKPLYGVVPGATPGTVRVWHVGLGTIETFPLTKEVLDLVPEERDTLARTWFLKNLIASKEEAIERLHKARKGATLEHAVICGMLEGRKRALENGDPDPVLRWEIEQLEPRGEALRKEVDEAHQALREGRLSLRVDREELAFHSTLLTDASYLPATKDL